MIHRSFLIKIFRDPRYSYTRVTCVSAALTIVREYERIKDGDVAAIWVVPAFTISAAIVIMLDLLHTPIPDETTLSRRRMIQGVTASLERDRANIMAMRGVKLLRALMNREIEIREAQPDTAQSTNGHMDYEDMFGPPPPLGSLLKGQDGVPLDYGGFEALFEGCVPYFSSGDLDLSCLENWS